MKFPLMVVSGLLAVSLSAPAIAQTTPPLITFPGKTAAPLPFQGSALSLGGLQSRSIQDTAIPNQAGFTLPGISEAPRSKGPLGGFEIGGGGLDSRVDPASVFPQIPAEYTPGMKLRLRLDPPQ